MARKVVICGVGMVPFKKPGRSDGYEVMGANAGREALTDAGLDYSLIEQAFTSYVQGDSCSGQAALYGIGMSGIPVTNVNNNCASGSTAFALAAQAIEYGISECVMALGFEQMAPGAIEMMYPDRTSPLQRHTDAIVNLMSLDLQEAQLPPAVLMFSCQAEALMNDYGISEQALASIAVKARKHAEFNPYAIYREPLSSAKSNV